MKKLTKSRTDRKLAGVCGGLGEYLNVDSTLIRLVMAILAFTGSGLLIYLIMAIVMPEEE